MLEPVLRLSPCLPVALRPPNCLSKKPFWLPVLSLQSDMAPDLMLVTLHPSGSPGASSWSQGGDAVKCKVEVERLQRPFIMSYKQITQDSSSSILSLAHHFQKHPAHLHSTCGSNQVKLTDIC